MRLILDTNVWSEIGRRDSRQTLERLAVGRRWQILTPPAVLLEVLRTSDDTALQSILEVLSSKHWIRLRTEADQESQEFIGEARRLRPAWVRTIPLPGAVAHYRTYWQKTAWRQAREKPLQSRDAAYSIQTPADTAAFEEQKFNRDRRLADNSDLSDLRSILVEPADWSDSSLLHGWQKGRKVEWWRVQAHDIFWRELRRAPLVRRRGRNSTYTDWLEPFLLLDRVLANPVDFTQFWFDGVDEVSMPRIWLRWAVQTAQLMGKVTPSSPRDNQLSTYLPDCDVFVSADKRLIRAIALVAVNSRSQLPDLMTFPSLNDTGSAVATLGDLLNSKS